MICCADRCWPCLNDDCHAPHLHSMHQAAWIAHSRNPHRARPDLSLQQQCNAANLVMHQNMLCSQVLLKWCATVQAASALVWIYARRSIRQAPRRLRPCWCTVIQVWHSMPCVTVACTDTENLCSPSSHHNVDLPA